MVNLTPLNNKAHSHTASITTSETEGDTSLSGVGDITTSGEEPSPQNPGEANVLSDDNSDRMENAEVLFEEVAGEEVEEPTVTYEGESGELEKEPKKTLKALEEIGPVTKLGDGEVILSCESSSTIKAIFFHTHELEKQSTFGKFHDAFYLEENSRSSSLEEEEDEKTSEAIVHGAFRRTTEDSRHNWVFDPGIPISSLSSGQRLLSITMRTRGRVLYKWRRLMQEHFLSLVFSILGFDMFCYFLKLSLDFYLVIFYLS